MRLFLLMLFFASLQAKESNLPETSRHNVKELKGSENNPVTQRNKISARVNVVTGEYVDESMDLVVAGCQPLSFRRFFSAFAPYDPRYVGWLMNPEAHAVANFNFPKSGKVSLPIFASIGETSGMVVNNTSKIDQMFKFDPSQQQGFCHAETTGQRHPLNLHVEYHVGLVDPKNTDRFSFDGTIVDGAGGKREFTTGWHTWHHEVFQRNKTTYCDSYTYIPPVYWLPYQLKMTREYLPNGNIIDYEYNEPWRKHKDWPSYMLLTKITAYNNSSKGKLLGEIRISYNRAKMRKEQGKKKVNEVVGFKIVGSDKREAVLCTSGLHPIMLDRASFPSDPSILYHYNHHAYTAIQRPDGRVLETKYDSQGRVASQLATVAPNGDRVPIGTYTYHAGATEVQDAENNLTIHRYDANKRITAVEFYEEGSLIKVEKNSWNANNGNLIQTTLEDGRGVRYLQTDYLHDDRHNVIQETLTDGKQSYTIFRTFNAFNLKTSETDGFGKITTYDYVPGTNLLAVEFVYADKTICKRVFCEYDDCAVCIKTILDDGSSKDPDDLTGVTYRLIKYITPKQTIPCFGLPEIVEEKTLNSSGQEVLLHKTIYEYTSFGQIVCEQHFDSNGRLSHTLQKKYDARERLIAQIDVLGSTIEYKYDDNNNCLEQKGPRDGQIICWSYDKADRPNLENNAGLTTQTNYDCLSRIVAKIDPSGNQAHYEYDTLSRLIQIIHPDGAIEKKEYDILDRVIKEIDPKGYETYYAYDFRGNPILITYPDGTKEHFVYHPNGSLLEHLDTHGIKTIYTYDVFQRPIKEETYGSSGELLKTSTSTYSAFHKLSETGPDGVTTHYEYDFAGRKIAEKTLERETFFAYDALGRLYRTQQGETVQYEEHDLLDRVIEKRTEDLLGAILFKENYQYDESGNLIHTITCQGTSETVYNAQNLPIKHISPDGHITQIDYDYKRHFTKTTIDPLGIVKEEIHDPCGRLQEVKVKNPEGCLIQNRHFEYDLAGNQIKSLEYVYEGINHTKTILNQWEYGPQNRLERLVESGIKETRYLYDSCGRLEILIKPDQTELHHAYDALGRVVRQYSNRNDINYHYAYDKNDQVTEVFDAIQKTTTLRQYDSYGNLTQEILGNGFTLKSAYDPHGKRITCSYPNNTQAIFTYRANDLSQIDYSGFRYAYQSRNLAGKLTEMSFPKGSIHLVYDKCHRLKCLEASSFLASAYTYDPRGALLSYTYADALGEMQENYAYDSLNQLISENTHAYLYDSLYNRVIKDNCHHAINSLSQLMSDGETAFEYDPNGNLIKAGNTELTYDSHDRLSEVRKEGKKYQYFYDAFNRRLTKKTPQETIDYIWDGKNEIGSSKGELRILGEGFGAEIGAAAFIKLGKEIFIPIHDHRGAVVALLDTQGKVYETIRYTAFGEEIAGKGKCPWRFASKRVDPETGYYYFGRRYYNPGLGRWITTDPNGFGDGPNLYAYVKNCPADTIDLYGLWSMRNCLSDAKYFGWGAAEGAGYQAYNMASCFGVRDLSAQPWQPRSLLSEEQYGSSNRLLDHELTDDVYRAFLPFTYEASLLSDNGSRQDVMRARGRAFGECCVAIGSVFSIARNVSNQFANYIGKWQKGAQLPTQSFSREYLFSGLPGEVAESTASTSILKKGKGEVGSGTFRSQMSPQDAVRYDNYWIKHAPEQSTPYSTWRRYTSEGEIKQVTTYDRFGNRHRQYDLIDSRRGLHQHNFIYGQKFLRPKGIRSTHLPIDE